MSSVNTGTMQSMSDNNRVDLNQWTMSSMSGDNRVKVNHGVMNTMSWDNKVKENYWVITSMSGDNSGDINHELWRISAMSGDIEFERNSGVMETKSWDITVQENNGLIIAMSWTLQSELPPIKVTLEAVWSIISWNGSTVIMSGGNITIKNGRITVNWQDIRQWWNGNSLGGKLKVNDLSIDIKEGNYIWWLSNNRAFGVLPEKQPTQIGEYVVYKDWKKLAVNLKDQVVLCDTEVWKVAMLPASLLGKFQNIFDQWSQPRLK